MSLKSLTSVGLIRMPTWLYLMLLPLAFFASCTLSVGPIWKIAERPCIRDVAKSDEESFPVLTRTKDGKFAAASLGELGDNDVVRSVSSADEKQINRDLCDSLGWDRTYRYFQVLSDDGATIEVSLEYPTTHDAKLMGWYSLKQGIITPERILHYGPGFAFLVLPFSVAAGIAGVAIFKTFVKRRYTITPVPGKT